MKEKPNDMKESEYKSFTLKQLDNIISKESNCNEDEIDAIKLAKHFLERWWEL